MNDKKYVTKGLTKIEFIATLIFFSHFIAKEIVVFCAFWCGNKIIYTFWMKYQLALHKSVDLSSARFILLVGVMRIPTQVVICHNTKLVVSDGR